MKLCVNYARKPSLMLLTYQAIKMPPSPPHHATCISWACMMENMSIFGLQMQLGMGNMLSQTFNTVLHGEDFLEHVCRWCMHASHAQHALSEHVCTPGQQFPTAISGFTWPRNKVHQSYTSVRRPHLQAVNTLPGRASLPATAARPPGSCAHMQPPPQPRPPHSAALPCPRLARCLTLPPLIRK